MFAAAEWELPDGDSSNQGFERLRQSKIDAMTDQDVSNWNSLCEFIASEVGGVAFDVMTSGKTAPAEYSKAFRARILAVKIER